MVMPKQRSAGTQPKQQLVGAKKHRNTKKIVAMPRKQKSGQYN
jgi:hypothetical protein